MSSILVGELQDMLKQYPDDYEVIMSLTEYDPNSENHQKHSIAYINGVGVDDDFREVKLMN